MHQLNVLHAQKKMKIDQTSFVYYRMRKLPSNYKSMSCSSHRFLCVTRKMQMCWCRLPLRLQRWRAWWLELMLCVNLVTVPQHDRDIFLSRLYFMSAPARGDTLFVELFTSCYKSVIEIEIEARLFLSPQQFAKTSHKSPMNFTSTVDTCLTSSFGSVSPMSLLHRRHTTKDNEVPGTQAIVGVWQLSTPPATTTQVYSATITLQNAAGTEE